MHVSFSRMSLSSKVCANRCIAAEFIVFPTEAQWGFVLEVPHFFGYENHRASENKG